jgi:hypothetical protein
VPGIEPAPDALPGGQGNPVVSLVTLPGLDVSLVTVPSLAPAADSMITPRAGHPPSPHDPPSPQGPVSHFPCGMTISLPFLW